MKKSVIRDIFKGFRGHIETMPKPEKDDANEKISCDIYDELKEKLTSEQLKLHQKFVDSIDFSWSEEVDFYFVQGFKLGLLIGIECMEE